MSAKWPVIRVGIVKNHWPYYYAYVNCVLDAGIPNWISPFLFIPLYQFLFYPLLHKWVPSMLRRISAGLFLQLVGFVLCVASLAKGYDQTRGYLTCNTPHISPEVSVEWYWKLGPLALYGVGRELAYVTLLEFIIAQSPDKMKGLAFGIMLAFYGIGNVFAEVLQVFLFHTLCYDIPVLLLLTVLFLVFLVLSKHYTLRERNKEINIQAIVEEHYERYLDQEEEYIRGQHYYRYTGHYCKTDTRQ